MRVLELRGSPGETTGDEFLAAETEDERDVIAQKAAYHVRDTLRIGHDRVILVGWPGESNREDERGARMRLLPICQWAGITHIQFGENTRPRWLHDVDSERYAGALCPAALLPRDGTAGEAAKIWVPTNLPPVLRDRAFSDDIYTANGVLQSIEGLLDTVVREIVPQRITSREEAARVWQEDDRPVLCAPARCGDAEYFVLCALEDKIPRLVPLDEQKRRHVLSLQDMTMAPGLILVIAVPGMVVLDARHAPGRRDGSSPRERILARSHDIQEFYSDNLQRETESQWMTVQEFTTLPSRSSLERMKAATRGVWAAFLAENSGRHGGTTLYLSGRAVTSEFFSIP